MSLVCLGVSSNGREGELVAYADDTYPSCNEDRPSVSGASIKFAWGEINLSSFESEYISLAKCVKEVLFLRNVFGSLSARIDGRKVTVLEDSEGAIKSANNPLSSFRSRQIHVRFQVDT